MVLSNILTTLERLVMLVFEETIQEFTHLKLTMMFSACTFYSDDNGIWYFTFLKRLVRIVKIHREIFIQKFL